MSLSPPTRVSTLFLVSSAAFPSHGKHAVWKWMASFYGGCFDSKLENMSTGRCYSFLSFLLCRWVCWWGCQEWYKGCIRPTSYMGGKTISYTLLLCGVYPTERCCRLNACLIPFISDLHSTTWVIGRFGVSKGSMGRGSYWQSNFKCCPKSVSLVLDVPSVHFPLEYVIQVTFFSIQLCSESMLQPVVGVSSIAHIQPMLVNLCGQLLWLCAVVWL